MMIPPFQAHLIPNPALRKQNRQDCIRFGVDSSAEGLPTGLQLYEPPAKQRILSQPVFLSYHPIDIILAQDVTQILNTFGLAVVKRDWNSKPTLTPSKQHDWLNANTRHTFALVSPQYSDVRGVNAEKAQVLLGELINSHEFSKASGAERSKPGASYVYPLMVRNGRLNNNYIDGFWPSQITLSPHPNEMMKQILQVARGIPDLAV